VICNSAAERLANAMHSDKSQGGVNIFPPRGLFLLQGYQVGYEVGCCISLERIIELDIMWALNSRL
jgi:hypothetical protein